MTRFILSHHKLAFPHILQHQLCIKIPHLPFWALADVVKEPRSSFNVAGDFDYVCVTQRLINSVTFSLLLCNFGCSKCNSLWRGYWRVKVGLFIYSALPCSPCLIKRLSHCNFYKLWKTGHMGTNVGLDIPWHIKKQLNQVRALKNM